MHRSQGRDHLPQLEQFFDQGYLEEVLGLVKTGKEASVYCCRGGPVAGVELVAAKIYRARQYRFKNDAIYLESRVRELGIRGSALRAFNKRRKSAVGREVQAGAWHHREHETLRLLYDAGSDVPRPLLARGDVMLMEFFGDEEAAASQLNRVRLEPAEAPPLFQRLLNNVELWLACSRVHGDLSPHNVLYWRGDIRVIDFPQACDPRFNRAAHDLLRRDVANICRYFGPYGVEADGEWLADDLWRRFTFAEL